MQFTHMKSHPNNIYLIREHIKLCFDLMTRLMRLIRGVDVEFRHLLLLLLLLLLYVDLRSRGS